MSAALAPPARAFDAIAETFDERYGGWLSVAAQRSAVRACLLAAFPPGARVLEVGGGTGEDALWLARRGREVVLTDAAPAMVRVASAKLAGAGRAVVSAAEELERLDEPPFDGAFSNFAALNCVIDLAAFARGAARLLRPGAPLLLVVFGPLPPAEVVVQLARGDARSAFRRLSRGEVRARLGGRAFTVLYHRPREIERVLAPWFRPVGRRGIGVFVPPSAAEPWISGHPRLLRALEALDRAASRPLALLGDHLLLHLRRTDSAAPGARG
jgi:ubiquinone/menaquinone biosynthesis C-methylase UbiE